MADGGALHMQHKAASSPGVREGVPPPVPTLAEAVPQPGLPQLDTTRYMKVDQWDPKRVAIWLHRMQKAAHWDKPDLAQKVDEKSVTGKLMASSPAQVQQLLKLSNEEIDEVQTWVRLLNETPARAFKLTMRESAMRKGFNQEKEVGRLTEEEVEQVFAGLREDAAFEKSMEEDDATMESEDSSDEDQDIRPAVAVLPNKVSSLSPKTRTVAFPQLPEPGTDPEPATEPEPEPKPEPEPEPGPGPGPERELAAHSAGSSDLLTFDVEMEDSTRAVRCGTAALSSDILSLRLGPVRMHPADDSADISTVEGECAKQKPTSKKWWPNRYAKIQGRGLFFYDSKTASKHRDSSIEDVTGCRVTKGEEKFKMSGTWHSITLERKSGMLPLTCERASRQGTSHCSSTLEGGVVCHLCHMYTSGRKPEELDSRADGFTRFCFKYSADRDRFFNALQNLAYGYPNHDAGPYTTPPSEHRGATKQTTAEHPEHEYQNQDRQIDVPLRAFARLDTNLVSEMIPVDCIEAAVTPGNGQMELSSFVLKLQTATLRGQLFDALMARQAALAAAVVDKKATVRDLSTDETDEVTLHLQDTVLQLSSESGTTEIAMETVDQIFLINRQPDEGLSVDGPRHCIGLNHFIGSTFRDSETQPAARTRLEFSQKPARDDMLIELRSRLLTARLANTLRSGMAANGLTRISSLRHDVPTTVELKTVIRAETFADYVFKCTKADGTNWLVQKRFREFEALRKKLGQLDSRVLTLAFPQKSRSPRSSVSERTVSNRRNELETWTVAAIAHFNHYLNTGAQSNPFAATLCEFFAANEEVTANSPQMTLSRQRTVNLPADTADVNSAMMCILQLLPDISPELLQMYCGGAAKQGWMFKEGERHAGWKRRWMVLWPAEPHPSFGRILVYFETPDATKAKGAIQILAPVVKAPKTPRKAHFCIRVHANKILDATNLGAMRMRDRKFILGTYDEESVCEWIQLFRASGPAWKPSERDADFCGWLNKKSTKGIGWWTKEWMEIREGQLVQQQRTASRTPTARWQLDAYALYVRSPETRSREWEFILIPKMESGIKHGDAQDSRTKERCVYLNANCEHDFNGWRARLLQHMDEADAAQAERQLKNVAPPLAPGQSPEDYDLKNVLGKGGYGKVMLVKRKNGKDNELMAMKMMDKAFIVKQRQEQHVLDELDVMRQVQHPFIIDLYNAFQTTTSLFLVMEFMQGGDLYITLKQRPEQKFSEDETRFIAAEICLALCYLHNEGIAFRDLKPENVMFDLSGHVRLIDFGLAKQNISDIGRLTVCGTPIYMSPEIVHGLTDGSVQTSHPQATDWWAFGTLIYEMILGKPPFNAPSLDRLMVRIASSELKIPVGHVSSLCGDIIHRLLNKTDSSRLGSEDSSDVQQHEWFANIDFDALYRKEICPLYVPEDRGEPLSHFPDSMTEQIVDVTDFRSPAAKTRAALAAAKDTFEGFDFRRSRDALQPAPEPEHETDVEPAA